MIKNKTYVIILGIITLSVISLLALVCQKYLPFLFHSTIYYCQNIIRTVSVQLLPSHVGRPLFIGLLIIFGLIVIRFFTLIYNFLKERKKFQHAAFSYGELQKIARGLRIESKVKVIKDYKPLAICFGIFQPKIYISSGLLKIVNNGELRVILAHEKYHLESRDNFLMLIAFVIQSFFPFFPIIKDFIKYFRIQRELEADTYAITNHNKNGYLISALKKLIRYEPQHALIASSGLGVFDTLETRIRYLVYKTKYRPKITIINGVVSGFFLFVLIALSLVPVQATDLHDRGNDTLMACISSDKCSSICKDNINKSLQITSIKSSKISSIYPP